MRNEQATHNKPSYNHIVMTTANLPVIFWATSGFHCLEGGVDTSMGRILVVTLRKFDKLVGNG